jgi:hypothetical protein
VGGSNNEKVTLLQQNDLSPPLTVKRPNDPRSLVREQAPGTSWRHPDAKSGNASVHGPPGSYLSSPLLAPLSLFLS